MAIKKGDAKYTKPFVGKTDVIIMMSVECGVSFASTCRLDYDTVHALEKMIVDVSFVEDETGQTEKCDRPQMDCENCWKELHCRAKPENSSEKPNNCETCRHNDKKWYELPCDYCCGAHSGYEPKTVPQTTMDCSKCECFTDGGERCDLCALGIMDEPQTDAEITELAKEIVHKMIDNSDIADDTYPDLRQRMHEAVEQLDEYYPSEDERSE